MTERASEIGRRKFKKMLERTAEIAHITESAFFDYVPHRQLGFDKQIFRGGHSAEKQIIHNGATCDALELMRQRGCADAVLICKFRKRVLLIKARFKPMLYCRNKLEIAFIEQKRAFGQKPCDHYEKLVDEKLLHLFAKR